MPQLVDRAQEVAFYYGFSPLPEALIIRHDDREKAGALEGAGVRGKSANAPLPTAEEHAALFRYVEGRNLLEGPLPVMFSSRAESTHLPRRKTAERRLMLAIIGSGKSIAEALLIQSARAMLLEEGIPSVCVSVNSLGDKESANRFFRELASYCRKHLSELSASCRALCAKSPAAILGCPHEKCRLIAEETPKAIAFLSESGRAHFKEVLEHLEELEIPYRIDHRLVGSGAPLAETAFELRAADADAESPPLGAGMRANGLLRRFGARRETPFASIGLMLPRAHARGVLRKLRPPKTSLFFLQLGAEAKLKSLRVIEMLRRAKIPVCHSLARDKLVSQLATAEHLHLSYTIIMGLREALEDSVIVRNATTRAQETVKIAELPAYLKRHKMA